MVVFAQKLVTQLGNGLGNFAIFSPQWSRADSLPRVRVAPRFEAGDVGANPVDDNGVVSQLDIAQLAIGMVGGLALFLFGLKQLTDTLQAAAGDRLRKLLGRFTSNRFLGVGTGAITTAVLQSSSITTVLLVGFSSVICR